MDIDSHDYQLSGHQPPLLNPPSSQHLPKPNPLQTVTTKPTSSNS